MACAQSRRKGGRKHRTAPLYMFVIFFFLVIFGKSFFIPSTTMVVVPHDSQYTCSGARMNPTHASMDISLYLLSDRLACLKRLRSSGSRGKHTHASPLWSTGHRRPGQAGEAKGRRGVAKKTNDVPSLKQKFPSLIRPFPVGPVVRLACCGSHGPGACDRHHSLQHAGFHRSLCRRPEHGRKGGRCPLECVRVVLHAVGPGGDCLETSAAMRMSTPARSGCKH